MKERLMSAKQYEIYDRFKKLDKWEDDWKSDFNNQWIHILEIATPNGVFQMHFYSKSSDGYSKWYFEKWVLNTDSVNKTIKSGRYWRRINKLLDAIEDRDFERFETEAIELQKAIDRC